MAVSGSSSSNTFDCGNRNQHRLKAAPVGVEGGRLDARIDDRDDSVDPFDLASLDFIIDATAERRA